MTIANNIKSTIKNTEDAKEFMKSVEKCYQSESADKSLARTLMSTLTNIKFDGSRTIHEHILEMTNLAARLKTMGMEVNENFLVTFILNSLPSEYGPFHMNYNTLKDKWNVHELQSMLIQEEARLKKPIIHSANLMGHKGAGKKPGKKNGKGNHRQLKVKQSSAPIHKKGQIKDKYRFCNKPGHYQKDCLKRKAWFENKGKHNALVCFESNLTEVPYNTWWIDSGCITHVFNKMQGFLTTRTTNPNERFIFMGNRVKVPVEAVGTYRLTLDTGHHLDLFATFYVPSISRNLISLSKLDTLGRKPSLRHLHIWGCQAEVRIYNPHEKKLDSRTTSVFFIGYLEKSKRYRFYCPNHSTRIVETGNVRFIENDIISGSLELRKVEIQEVRVEIPSSITSSQVVVPVIVDSVNNPQELQINGQTPHNDIVTNEPVTEGPQEIELRRFVRSRRLVISDDYLVYLHESEFDLSIDNDPVSFSQAIKVDNSTKWLDAMKEELKSMNDNEVWDLVELPKESKRVGCKWVFETKRDSNGNIERYKARLVAKGYTQKDGIDYKETFSPVSKKDSLRIIMALIAHYDLKIHQMDVKIAFLNGNLDEEVFMDQPEGFMVEGKEHMVCKLKMSIYGLKQASRQWYLKFNDTIKSFGFKENIVDRCIYLKISGSMLGRYQSNPGMDHWKTAKKVLRYLQGTKDYMLTYKRSDHLEVIGYSDSDFFGCVDTRKSTFGYLFLLAEGAISWKSAKQSIIAASTMEAEFVACFEATVHGLWLRNFISGLGIVDCNAKPLRIYCDNSAAVFF
ncbi:copia-like pol polyprotein [Cucumis melo var. makuwa]|uniref:Copia-like pol polyprotein n=1 Tax=Cucumis melo var. makuwa TaxID=1194695 RepID=A0A5A7V4M3_CUCMM|nr:copia-like pol polyprotein [Cucumis melo var. makuwa]TYK15399.1 copia-like pol polyprotein [Cucumis melo var. makuwa]